MITSTNYLHYRQTHTITGAISFYTFEIEQPAACRIMAARIEMDNTDPLGGQEPVMAVRRVPWATQADTLWSNILTAIPAGTTIGVGIFSTNMPALSVAAATTLGPVVRHGTIPELWYKQPITVLIGARGDTTAKVTGADLWIEVANPASFAGR